jgi:hypothetical protein
MYDLRHYEWVQKYAKRLLFYIIVHIPTTTSCITTGRIWVWIFTSILMSGSEGCFEFCDIERFGEVGEESSFLAFILSRLLG